MRNLVFSFFFFGNNTFKNTRTYVVLIPNINKFTCRKKVPNNTHDPCKN
jgi:hypothetical protein